MDSLSQLVPEIDIGFTGTQEGMTDRQKIALKNLLKKYKIKEFRHGDCVGADEEANTIIGKVSNCKVIIHPPVITDKRAFCKGDKIMAPKQYLTRNRDIVDKSDIIIGAPKEFKEQKRGGTWYTLRYAITQNKRIIIVYPDGTTNLKKVNVENSI